jgi:hypothetical protein
MKLPSRFSRRPAASLLLLGAAVGLWCVFLLRADRIEMQNGDRYTGKVLSVDSESVSLQNESLGKVRIPRARISAVIIGTPGANAQPSPASPSVPETNGVTPFPGSTNLVPSGAAALTTNSAVVRQVQQQLLGNAGPEAQKKFTELLGGFLSGKLTVEDIRAEARSIGEQVRAVKGDLDPEQAAKVDGYLAILDRFLKETAPGGVSSTNPSTLRPTSPPR